MGLGIGIIGLGAISDFHAEAAKAVGKDTLVACCSRDLKKAQAFGRKHACAAYGTVEEFLKHPGLDVVSVSTAAGHHMEPALAAIAAGKHIIVEKPLEISLERCDRIIEAAEKKGVLVAGVFQSRFNDVARVIKDAIEKGRFGRISLGDAYVKWFRSQEYYDKNLGRGTWSYDGGGSLMNQGIHAVDLLQWFMGPVESLSAYTSTVGHTGIEVEDNAVAALRFKSGAFGTIEASTAVFPGFLKKIEISGTTGSMVLEETLLKAWEFAKSDACDEDTRRTYGGEKSEGGGAADPLAIGFDGHRRQFQDLMMAIESGGRPLVDGVEARKSVEIILAIYRSASERKEVLL
ncbi:MAG TPA: Gfo/Idh/MocA family oxidoreductase [Spirochaetia bacterium]|nr:Gfo/Idh/MocA family oxidoreductase [Spirochaetia bacterium]